MPAELSTWLKNEPCLNKPGSTTSEDSQRLEILDLGSKYNVLCRKNKGADQRCGCHAADLRLCFFAYAKCKFSHDAAQMYIKEKLLNDLSSFEPS